MIGLAKRALVANRHREPSAASVGGLFCWGCSGQAEAGSVKRRSLALCAHPGCGRMPLLGRHIEQGHICAGEIRPRRHFCSFHRYRVAVSTGKRASLRAVSGR